MRITPKQIETIVKTIRIIAGLGVKIWPFGVRLDGARGGDDLHFLIESDPAANLIQRTRIKLLLEQALQLPVDTLATCSGPPDSAVVGIAGAYAMQIDGQRPAACTSCLPLMRP